MLLVRRCFAIVSSHLISVFIYQRKPLLCVCFRAPGTAFPGGPGVMCSSGALHGSLFDDNRGSGAWRGILWGWCSLLCISVHTKGMFCLKAKTHSPSISCGNAGLTASFFVFSLQYLFDNGRVDDVFSDQYYTRFAHSLHQILDPWRPSIHPLGVYKKPCNLCSSVINVMIVSTLRYSAQ